MKLHSQQHLTPQLSLSENHTTIWPSFGCPLVWTWRGPESWNFVSVADLDGESLLYHELCECRNMCWKHSTTTKQTRVNTEVGNSSTPLRATENT